jgi:hypothetical protein
MKTYFILLYLFAASASLCTAETTVLSVKPAGEWIRVDYSEDLNGRLVPRILLLRKSVITSVEAIPLEPQYSDPLDANISKDPKKIPFKIEISSSELYRSPQAMSDTPAASKIYTISGFDTVRAQEAIAMIVETLSS